MKHLIVPRRLMLLKILTLAAVLSFRAEGASVATNSAPLTTDPEVAYTRTLEKRVADILAGLDPKDPARTAKVHDLIIGQYRALRDWHDANDRKLKGAAEEQAQPIRASLKALHEEFVAALAAELTPEQVEVVKDKMTYGTVKATYQAYCEIVPGLTETEKAKILELLKEAREEAMDGGSHNEKAAIFKKYKGRINNYLARQGYDVKQAYKDWGEKQKSK